MKGTGILQALLTMDVVAVAGLLATVWAADAPVPGAEDPYARHMLWGLAATFLNLVARCIAIFYMLASGRALKDLVAEVGLDPSFVQRHKRIKRMVETLATLALVPVMGAAMAGGMIGPDGISAGTHVAWSWTAVGFAVLCLVVDVRAGIRNYALLREADEHARRSG